MSNKDISYTQSITSIPKDSTRNTEPGSSKGCLRVCKSFKDTLGEMMDFSLMKNPVFALYGASCFLCMTGKFKLILLLNLEFFNFNFNFNIRFYYFISIQA